MDTWIVTGGAGFIGSNFVRLALARSDARVVVVDKLTYAGNLESLADVAEHPRFHFVKADIADRAAVDQILREHRPSADPQLRRRDARRPLDRRAGRLHPDQRLRSLRAARRRAAPRRAARRRLAPALPLPPRLDRRGLRLARPDRGLRGDDALRAELALFGLEGRRRSPGARLPCDLRAAGAAHELLEQLRAVSVPGEADPADDPERDRGQAAADLRRRRQRARLAARRGPLRGRCCGCCERGRPGERYNLGGGEERTNLEIVDAICAQLEQIRPASQNPALVAAGIESYAALKRFVPDRPGHDRRYAIDASKIRAELGWRPQRDLAKGLAETVRWYLEHRDWCAEVQAGRYARERLGLGYALPLTAPSRVREFPDLGCRTPPASVARCAPTRRRARDRERRRRRSRAALPVRAPARCAQRLGKLPARFRRASGCASQSGDAAARERAGSAARKPPVLARDFSLEPVGTKLGRRSPRPLPVGGCMRHAHTVLFVDDEVNILKALQRLLRSEHMNVLCASRAQEALELLDKQAVPGRRHRSAHARDVGRRPALPGAPALPRHRAHDAHRLHRDGRRRRRHQPRRDLPADHEAVERRRAARHDPPGLRPLRSQERDQAPEPGDARAELQAPGHEPQPRGEGPGPHQAGRGEAPGAAHRLHPDDPRAGRGRRRQGRLHARPLRAGGRLRLEDHARDGLPEGVHRAGLHRGSAARRRQDRRARLGDHEAGPAHARGVRRDQAAPGDRRQDPGARRLPRRRRPLRAPPPRVVRRLGPRLPRPPARATRSRCPRASSWSPTPSRR